MTIELHQFAIRWDLPSPSPFCLKLETWLRLAEIPYENKPWSPMTAPQGKAPFVVVDGQTIPDSGRIICELTERFNVGLDERLSPLEKAHALLIRRLARHPPEEIAALVIADVDAVLTVLGDDAFFFGDTPTSIDATAYGFFAQMVHPVDPGVVASHCRNQPTLVAYVERMRQRVWADWSPAS